MPRNPRSPFDMAFDYWNGDYSRIEFQTLNEIRASNARNRQIAADRARMQALLDMAMVPLTVASEPAPTEVTEASVEEMAALMERTPNQDTFLAPGNYTGRVTSARVEGDRLHTEMEVTRAPDPDAWRARYVNLVAHPFSHDLHSVEPPRPLPVPPRPPVPAPRLDTLGTVVTPTRRRTNRGPRQYRPAPGCKAFP